MHILLSVLFVLCILLSHVLANYSPHYTHPSIQHNHIKQLQNDYRINRKYHQIRPTNAHTWRHQQSVLIDECDSDSMTHDVDRNNDPIIMQKLDKVWLVSGGNIVNHMASLNRESSFSLKSVKLILQLLLSAFNIACWAIPFRNRNALLSEKFTLSLANLFAAGVFLMLSLSHMLPHAMERWGDAELFGAFNSWLPKGFSKFLLHTDAVQGPLLCMAGGYLLVLLLDKVLGGGPIGVDHRLHSNEVANTNANAGAYARSSEVKQFASGTFAPKSSILLLLAMAVHSFFETLALGMSPNISSSIVMALSIASHQPAESLSLLLALLRSGLSDRAISSWLTLFSLVGSIGVSFGIVLQRLASPKIEAIIVSLIAGSFLYVSATEIIPEELQDEGSSRIDRIKRFTAILSGVVLILCVNAISHRLEASA